MTDAICNFFIIIMQLVAVVCEWTREMILSDSEE